MVGLGFGGNLNEDQFLRRRWLHVTHLLIHRYWEWDIENGDAVKASIINTKSPRIVFLFK